MTTEVLATGMTLDIARDTAGLMFAELPDDVVELALQAILDTLGVAIAGALSDAVERVLDVALAEGGAAVASVIGHGTRLAPRQAALVNGVAAHALDFDDCNLTMQGHASAVLLPALLALGERHRVDGRSLVTAFVAGVEAGCRVGASMAPWHYDLGFHATGTHGTIAAAAGTARLLGLAPDTTAHALSLAATMAAGLKAQFGTMAKPLHAGRAAENGLYATLLAATGVRASPTAIEAAQGYAATHAPHYRPEAALGGPPQHFRIRDNLFKFHAACYGTQGVIEAAAEIREQPGFTLAGIEAVVIEAAAENEHTCAIEQPESAAEARFSMHHAAAMALSGIDTADPAAFAIDGAARDELKRLRSRMTTRFVPGLHIAASTVIVRDRDGRHWRASVHAGQPVSDLPRQRQRLEAKFKSLVAPLAGAELTAALLAMVGDITTLADVGVLAERAGRKLPQPR